MAIRASTIFDDYTAPCPICKSVSWITSTWAERYKRVAAQWWCDKNHVWFSTMKYSKKTGKYEDVRGKKGEKEVK